MRKNWNIISVFTIIAVLTAIYLLGNNKEKTSTLSPKAVKTVNVKTWERRPGVSLAGIVKPLQEAKLAFQVSGRLSGQILSVGTPVVKGTVLASLDPVDYQAQAEAAEAQVEAARAGIQQAGAVMENYSFGL